jgi:uncharacterized membrane protein YedE/YeeE
MTELLFWCAWLGLATGLLLGLNRMLDVLALAASAGAAALAVHALQVGGPWPSLHAGGTLDGVAVEALAYLTAVAACTGGWMLGRLQRDPEG